MTARALVVADTHLGDGQAPRLIDRLRHLLDGLDGLDGVDGHDGVDAIFHAGDIVHPSVLGALREYAPVHAVLGNNDVGVRLPERIEVELGGCIIGMLHDSGPSAGRDRRLRRIFPGADVVLFGHSHIPWHETHVERGHVQHHVNPGSAMQRRRQPACTVAVLTLAPGAIGVEIVALG